MAAENDNFRREQVASERRNRRQQRAESKRLKRERRLTRLQKKGWNETFLRQHERDCKNVAEKQRKSSSIAPAIIKAVNESSMQHERPSKLLLPERTLRIAVVGCGGWFCNRAHLPALAKIMRKSNVCITVLCGSNHERALTTLRRNGVSLTVQQQDDRGDGDVTVFDTLEAYLNSERRLSGQEEGAIPRDLALADVCLLVLPIPKMTEAIGKCLRAGKYVISEKPVSANSYASQSLWDAARFLRAGQRWAVSENWAYKPSVHAARRLVQTEVLLQQSKPVSYRLEMVQSLDNAGWRLCGHDQYDGGAARDVGVHCIRALRCIFGEIERVKDCEFTANEGTCLLHGTLVHGGSGISGILRADLKENLDSSLHRADLTIDFGSGKQLVWDISKGTFHRYEDGETPILVERVEGDPWVSGGVRELLAAALGLFHENEFGRSPQMSPEHAGLSCLECTPEEAFRDAAVVDAMLASCGQSSDASSAQSALENGDTTVVRRHLPYPLLSRMDHSFSNSLGTVSFRPAEVAWCSSVEDVVSAVSWSQQRSLEVCAFGTCHSSCLFRDNGVGISTSLMSRILDFRVDNTTGEPDGQKRAYVRVGTGMILNTLANLLKASNYTLPSFPILLNQSVGGAIATGSHGSSALYGTISDSVCAVRFVSQDGRVRTILPNAASYNVLHTMVSSDANEVVYSDKLMKILRCSCGSLGVVTDVVLELTPAIPLCRKEVMLDMNAPDVCQSLQRLALETDHCWAQWVIGKDEDSDEAAAITLSKVSSFHSDMTSELYHGRCWYPYGETVARVMRKERKREAGETKHTMQWSFPLDSLGCVINFLKANRLDLSARVVEFKFLSASELTALGPNALRGGLKAGAPIVALNVWWELMDLRLFEMLEGELRMVPEAKPHYGKWFSRDEKFTRPSPSVGSVHSTSLPKPILLSIIMPVYNAMPWLATALRDILKQDVKDEVVEILAGDDASSDGSLEFLISVALALGERGSIEVVGKGGTIVSHLTPVEAEELVKERNQNGVAQSINPALLAPSRDADALPSDHFDDMGPSCNNVARETGPRNRLRILLPEEFVNCGQGAVMTRCLKAAHGAYIGHMESDDARPDGAFQEMIDALRAHPEFDGVVSNTECFGSNAAGMERYVKWQNQLDTPNKMRRSRFVEIPALHQTGIFRTPAVLLSIEEDCYRDDQKWPVDLHFWLSFFHAGLKVGKVKSVLFYWRQHHGQQTRNHGRLSISNMRKCKCEFLCKDGGPIRTDDGAACDDIVIEIWSSGKTLEGWVNDMTTEVKEQGMAAKIVPVDWKPGNVRPPHIVVEGHQRRVHLFAFGMEKARRQVRELFAAEWNDSDHIFVA